MIGDLAAERVYLTEGALKGTIAHYLSGATFVCVAGVNQYRNLKPVLERMKGYGMKQLLEAYDMDKKMKVACNKHDSKCAVCFERSPVICQHKAEKRRIIQNGCNKVYEICRELSLPMNRMVWDMDESGEWNGKHKGIDDYLAAIKQKEGTGAQTSALPKGEQSSKKKRKYGSCRTHYLPVACFSRSGRKTLWCLSEVSERGRKLRETAGICSGTRGRRNHRSLRKKRRNLRIGI